MSTTRTELLTWLPEAADCVQGGSDSGDDPGYWCEHPAVGDGRTPQERELSTLTGYGATPVAAYASFLDRLTDWQEEKQEARERFNEADYEYACADDAGQMQRDGD